MPKYFCAQKIYHNGEFCTDSALALNDEGLVLGILPYKNALENPKDLIDFGERILSPGWIDLQVNGCGGGLFNRDLNSNCLEKILRHSLQHGTTSIQPTLISCSDEEIITALEVIRQAKKLQTQKSLLWQGVIGMHLEGPYISTERRGAHPAHQIRPLDEPMLKKLESAGCEGVLNYITVAAESVRPEQVARLSASGLSVSLGHSGAPSADSRALLRAGARCFTHLYNGMGGIHSRKPSTLSLALENPSSYSSIIADGYHVAPENMRIAQRLMGERLFLITDATATENDGELYFGEQLCKIRDGKICNEEGSLAGSALTMQRGVAILSELFGLETALAMATRNPARALNPQNKQDIGDFAPGSKGNFVVLEDSKSDLETWILGQHWQT